jgi:sterol 14-demethylase
VTWRVVVDLDLCQSHGVCEGEAPELFEVAKRSKVVVLDATPPDSLRAQAEAAVKYCPTHALSIVDEGDPTGPEGD